MSLYFYILFFSVIVPILFTIFCIDFIKEWKYFTFSTLIIALFFIVWDVIFTEQLVWGFNEEFWNINFWFAYRRMFVFFGHSFL
jgi:hypothetical protein